MLYYFIIQGEKIENSDLRTLISKAKEVIESGQARTIEIFVVDEDDSYEEWLIDFPTKAPDDEPFLTKDWILCYERGCRFIRRKNRNEPFCGKLKNPRDPFESQTTPTFCPVTYPKWYKQEENGHIKIKK